MQLSRIFPETQSLGSFLAAFSLVNISQLSKLLTEITVCGPGTPSPPLVQSQNNAQSEVVDHVIALLLRTKALNNVLTYGYRQKGSHLENYFPNSIVSMIKQHVWQILLNHIGSDAMILLLTTTSMFRQVGNSFVQITGRSITDLSIDNHVEPIPKNDIPFVASSYSLNSYITPRTISKGAGKNGMTFNNENFQPVQASRKFVNDVFCEDSKRVKLAKLDISDNLMATTDWVSSTKKPVRKLIAPEPRKKIRKPKTLYAKISNASSPFLPWCEILYGKPVYSNRMIIAALPVTHVLRIGASIHDFLLEMFPLEHGISHPFINHSSMKLRKYLDGFISPRLLNATPLLESLKGRALKCNLQFMIDHYCPLPDMQDINVSSIFDLRAQVIHAHFSVSMFI